MLLLGIKKMAKKLDLNDKTTRKLIAFILHGDRSIMRKAKEISSLKNANILESIEEAKRFHKHFQTCKRCGKNKENYYLNISKTYGLGKATVDELSENFCSANCLKQYLVENSKGNKLPKEQEREFQGMNYSTFRFANIFYDFTPSEIEKIRKIDFAALMRILERKERDVLSCDMCKKRLRTIFVEINKPTKKCVEGGTLQFCSLKCMKEGIQNLKKLSRLSGILTWDDRVDKVLKESTNKEIDIICEKCKKIYSKGVLDPKDAKNYKKNYAYGLCSKCSKKTKKEF